MVKGDPRMEINFGGNNAMEKKNPPPSLLPHHEVRMNIRKQVGCFHQQPNNVVFVIPVSRQADVGLRGV